MVHTNPDIQSFKIPLNGEISDLLLHVHLLLYVFKLIYRVLDKMEQTDIKNDNNCTSLDEALEQTIYLMQGKG